MRPGAAPAMLPWGSRSRLVRSPSSPLRSRHASRRRDHLQCAIVLAIWFAGRYAGRRPRRADQLLTYAVRLESDQEQRAREAIAAETARIAGELHDIVAHSVSVMGVQAGAARALLDTDP